MDLADLAYSRDLHLKQLYKQLQRFDIAPLPVTLRFSSVKSA